MTTRTNSKSTSRSTSRSTRPVSRRTPTTPPVTSNWTATQIAEFINEASTPSEKGTATRRMNTYVESRVAAGADRVRVEQNIRSLCRRLGRG